MKKSIVLAPILALATVLIIASAVHADSFLITSDHATGGLGTPPFGTVGVVQNGTAVDVTIHLFSPYEFAKTGAADFQAFKFNATGVVLGDITIDAHTPALAAATGAFNGDGTGDFTFGINAPTQGPGASDPFTADIVFHVASATIADLTAPNNLGNIFVVDLFSSNLNGLTGTGNTGPADVTGGGVPGPVPEPATMFLLGSGLIGIGVYARKKFKK